MGWYIVVKTIKGRGYYYRQTTWREGRSFKCKSVYVKPVDGSLRLGPLRSSTVPLPDRTVLTKTVTIVPSAPRPTRPEDPDNDWDERAFAISCGQVPDDASKEEIISILPRVAGARA